MLFRAWTDEQRLVAPSSGRFFHPCFGESNSDGSDGSSIFLMKPQKLMGFRIWGRFFLRHESKDVFFLGEWLSEGTSEGWRLFDFMKF